MAEVWIVGRMFGFTGNHELSNTGSSNMTPEWIRSEQNPNVERMKFADGMITVVCIYRGNFEGASDFSPYEMYEYAINSTTFSEKFETAEDCKLAALTKLRDKLFVADNETSEEIQVITRSRIF